MNPDFMYIVWTAIAIAVMASAVVLIRFLIRLRPLIERLEGAAQILETSRPKIDRILDSLEAEIAELRGIGRKANRVVGNAEIVTTGLRSAVQPIITEVGDLANLVRHVRAATIAARVGMVAWWNHRRRDGEVPPEELEHNEGR